MRSLESLNYKEKRGFERGESLSVSLGADGQEWASTIRYHQIICTDKKK